MAFYHSFGSLSKRFLFYSRTFPNVDQWQICRCSNKDKRFCLPFFWRSWYRNSLFFVEVLSGPLLLSIIKSLRLTAIRSKFATVEQCWSFLLWPQLVLVPPRSVQKCSTMETSVSSIQHPISWTCSLTSTTKWNARIVVYKTLSATIGCSRGAQLAAQAASFCKSATSPRQLVATAQTARWQFLVPRNLCFQTASALTLISPTWAVKRRMKLTVSPTLPIGQNARIFAVPQLIAESGPFMMTFAFSVATGDAPDQIARTTAVLCSLISPPVMCSTMKTDLVTLEICHLILYCRNIFDKVKLKLEEPKHSSIWV